MLTNRVAGHFETIAYELEKPDNPRKLDFDDLRELIRDQPCDDTFACDLLFDDQLSVVEELTDRCDLELGSTKPDGLRLKIGTLACFAIYRLAEEKALETLDEIEDFFLDNDFSLHDTRFRNPFGWEAHRSEREEDGCVVYEYRKVEGEIDVDVWEYEPGDAVTLYLLRYLNSDEEGDD